MDQLVRDVASLWTAGRRVERVCYAIAGALILSGFAHLAVYAVDGGPWEGPVSWRKAVTFGLSFGITLVSVCWVARFVPLGSRTRTWLLGALAVASVAEVALVTLQCWRGVPSHFNDETPFDAAVMRTLAVGGLVLFVTLGWLTVAAARPAPGTPASMRLAVRVGLGTLMASLMVGGVMIAGGVTSVAAGDRQGAYLHGGWLKPAHAVLLHAVTVLPVLAWLASYTTWSEARRVRLVTAGAVSYLTAATAVIIGTVVSGLIDTATLTGDTALVAGETLVATAGVITLVAVLAVLSGFVVTFADLARRARQTGAGV
ncbi:hypothetical protein ACNTMW_08525 [Planosporangium sp. 12N6]|uniref:hypothetical protein n=1 Tax=Planosporangium spinosum TaxID=3402278 RepID=UPI003CF51A20